MDEYHIEPSARLIMAIGKDLIKDNSAAISELVKNAYDADSPKVELIFRRFEKKLEITISDYGHGMSKDTVINSWLVPGTSYKLDRKTSPNGRKYQGRKGIGRYAVSILGDELKLISVNDGKKIEAIFDWKKFSGDKKLSDIKIPIKEFDTNEKNGTKLIITANEYDAKLLSESDVEVIQTELKKLLVANESKSVNNKFEISMQFINFFKDESKNIKTEIESFEVNEYYNYNLVGFVSKNWEYKLKYTNAYTDEIEYLEGKFEIPKNHKEKMSYCGELLIDFKVYDQDSDGVGFIMSKMESQDSNKVIINRRTVSQLIKTNSGIGIALNEFRIRPYGDSGFDWLNLDNRRVQNPSMRIGANQIVGLIGIEDEDVSHLKEKSARDGLSENKEYFGLQYISIEILKLLEDKRFKFRKKNRTEKVNNELPIDELNDFSGLNEGINKTVQKSVDKIAKNPDKAREYSSVLKNDVSELIEDFQKEKSAQYKKVEEKIAIYQKQTTLGLIIGVVLHEGRKPLGWFNTIIPQIIKNLKDIKRHEKLDKLDKTIGYVERVKNESDRINRLFKRLDPLSSVRRKRNKEMNIEKQLSYVFEMFDGLLTENNIGTNITNLSDNGVVKYNEEDFYMAITNIIENSIFWLMRENKENKNIRVIIDENDISIIIDIIDNGPGISIEDIENSIIFEPGFSKKDEGNITGTGLGLAIAGEAIKRNNSDLIAVFNEKGAHFRILISKEVDINGEN